MRRRLLIRLSGCAKLKPLLLSIALLFSVSLFSSCATESAALKRKKVLEMADTSYQMGVVYFNDRNYVEALKSLTRAIELAPDNADYHNVLAMAYGARGHYDKAVVYFKKAVELDPNSSEAHVNLSAIYLKHKEWDLAIDASRGALKNVFYKTPEFAYNNIAWAMLRKRDFRGAVENFSRAVEVNPKYKWGYNNLGLALERLGEEERALKAYQTAISVDEEFADAYMNLGLLLMRRGEMGAAEEAFNKIIEFAPGSIWARSAQRYLDDLKSAD